MIFLLLALLLPAAHADDPKAFFLHDGDTVVFYGDSITEQQRYTRDIETFVLTRFPTWRVKFINSGWNGDRVSGGGGGTIDTRLRRDVLPYQPTVVTVLLGMNDAAYTHFDVSAYAAYTQGLTKIVDTLQQRLPNARLTLLTPSFYDEAAPMGRHTLGYNGVLVRYGAFVKKLGDERHILVVDLNAPLAAATAAGRRHDPKFSLVPDGVHPSEAGHLVMAAAILEGWHAPESVPDVALDPNHPAAMTAPLPWPLPKAARPALAVYPPAKALCRFRFHAPMQPGSRPNARYDLLVDGIIIGAWKRPLWAAGLDLSLVPSLPSNQQSQQVLALVQQRLDTWRYMWKGGPLAVARKEDAPSDAQTDALLALDHWLDADRDRAAAAARFQTHTYALRPAPPLPPIPRAIYPVPRTRIHQIYLQRRNKPWHPYASE